MNRTVFRLRRRRPAPSSERSLRRIAIHEAAHAVVCIRLSLTAAKVALLPPGEPECNGALWFDSGLELDRWVAALPEPWAVERLEAVATTQAAGVVAEVQGGSRVRGFTKSPRYAGGSCDFDGREVAKLASVLGSPSFPRFWNAATARATEILFMDGGRAWDRVATALLEAPNHYLPGESVRALVGPARAHRRLWDPPARDDLTLAPGLHTLAPAPAGALTE